MMIRIPLPLSLMNDTFIVEIIPVISFIHPNSTVYVFLDLYLSLQNTICFVTGQTRRIDRIVFDENVRNDIYCDTHK